MKNLKKICLRFAADRSGNIAIATGIAIVPLTLAIGVAVDYSMISNRKAHIQHALDTAALATAKNLGLVKSRAELKDLARSYFYANLNGLKPTDVKLVFHDSNTAGGTAIELSAYMDYKMLFGSLYEKKQRRIQKSSIVKTGNNSLEIALVLDNSGSMNWNNRIGTAKKAATGLINQLTEAFETSTHPAPVKFSVVPFTGHVNVGQQHARALWMDTTGLSPIHHENLNWQQNPRARAYGDGRWRDGSGRWLTRFSLFSDMIGVRWSGCVEARPWPHHTRDTSPNLAQPATLYVPAFAPDEPDNYSGQRQVSRSNPVYCSRTNRRKKCKLWSDGYRRNVHHTGARANTDLRNYTRQYMRLLDRSGNPFGGFDAAGGLVRNGPRISEERYSNSYLADDKNVPAPLHAYSAANTGRGAKQNARQDWTWKYSGQGPRVGSFVGPNHGCTGNPITALTTSKNRVISAINTMRANGYTNVPLGIAWGWRTLSPGQPFPEGRAYDARENQKIMIIMTDGNNYQATSATFNKSQYGAHGLQENGRLFQGFSGGTNARHTSSNYTRAMDEHMLKTCSNAKQAGIRLYTVAFDVRDGSSVKKALAACASRSPTTGKPLYFDAKGSKELLAAFKTIGSEVASLRIAE